MSYMMRSMDLMEWAKSMGFPGADSLEFEANAGRLFTPQLATMMRHLMKHVRPANDVTHIRKRLLTYRLGIDNYQSMKASEFESVADYEAFLKNNALEAKMMHCNMQVEKKQEDIKKLLTKLEEKGEQHQSQKLVEKEKMDKLRLLRAKREELEKQVSTFKEMVPQLESICMPKYHNAHNPLNSWELEVQKYCSTLERGQEIAVMCEHLREALKANNHLKMKDTSSGNENEMLYQIIENHHSSLGYEIMELKQKYLIELEHLENKKLNMMSKILSSEDISLIARANVLKKFIESGQLEAIGKAAERAFLARWIRKNRTSFDTSLCTSNVEEREKVAELDHMIAQVQDEISFLASVPATKLRSSLTAIISKMKAEATAACYKEQTPSTVVDKILSDLPQLIELFRKTPIFMKKVDSGTQSIQAYTELKHTFLKTATAKAFATLDVSVKEKISDSGSLIQQVEGKVAREKSRMGFMVNDLTETLWDIDRSLQYISGHLACWEKSSTTEVICTNPDYQELLTRLKNLPLK